MTTVENAFRTEIYDPDDVGLQNSPLLKPMQVKYQPSPSPPPNLPPPPRSPEPSTGSDQKGGNRPKAYHSQADAVLVALMGGGKNMDVARTAGEKPLASADEVEEQVNGTGVEVRVVEEGKIEAPTSKDVVMEEKEQVVQVNEDKEGLDLTALAAGAWDALAKNAQEKSEPIQKVATPKSPSPGKDAPQPKTEPMEGVKQTIPPIKSLYCDVPSAHPSPDLTIKHERGSSVAGELPPIRQSSPQNLANGHGSGQITLPSISDQLGDINHLPEPPVSGESPFPHSPPGRPIPRFSAVPGHGSPPKSPNDTFSRRELPSPGRAGHFYPFTNSHRRPSQTDGPQYSSAADYSSSNTETPSTDQSGSTPATIAIDRMSIDGITNPQIGGFQCTYPGCTAQPFQTQYLLNSHANVHSSNRPHYCSVKGCPRSEGGKGFKRKNEMIRHGLVHDSPGYVCPFCPDREHKYPRPDNLQRHVRVHHVDKDKDDAQLREVLSQRPEGPSRGRRRRLGTS